MKRRQATIGLIGLIVLVAVLAGLSLWGRPSIVNGKDRILVITTLPLGKSLVDSIGGKKVITRSIVKGFNCSHEYEPIATDMIGVAKCKIFVKIGAGFDAWADTLAANVAGKKAVVIDASRATKIITYKDQDRQNIANPHYWGNPDNVRAMAKNILDGLVAVKPEQKAYFNYNYRIFLKSLDDLSRNLQEDINRLASKRIVSYSASFAYYYQYFGFDVVTTIEKSCEQEVTPKHLAEAVKIMRGKKIGVIVGDALNPNPARMLAKETGARLVLLWPTTNESGDYLQTIRANMERLVAALE